MACRSFVQGKLYIIIGSVEGNPQESKCFSIVETAAKYADYVIVTDAHAISKTPKYLRSLYLKGAVNAIEIPDREIAIEYACKLLNKNDCVLIAGLGHEKCLFIGNNIIPYSDTECVKKIIQKLHKK